MTAVILFKYVTISVLDGGYLYRLSCRGLGFIKRDSRDTLFFIPMFGIGCVAIDVIDQKKSPDSRPGYL
jgi:hypothetical protein